MPIPRQVVSAPPSSRRCAHGIYGAPRGCASIAVRPPERRSFRAGRVLSLSRRNFRATRERSWCYRGGKLVVHGGPRENAAEEAGEGPRRAEGTSYGSDPGRPRAISAGLRK